MGRESGASRDSLTELANLRGRPVLLIKRGMDWNCVGETRGIAVGLGDADKLTVLLESPGGDIESAYRMLLALRDRVDDIEALVPMWAKSAATFFCLGADSIHMGRYAELGPLDPQIPDRSGSAIPISALETFKSLERLLGYSMNSLDTIVQTLLSSAPMDIPEAIEQARPLFAAIVNPLYRQVDPRELGQSGRYLAVSQDYAMRVMKRWAYSDRPDDVHQEIARRLVWDYPTHSFVIDLIEAQEIGLNAERMDDESDSVCRRILRESGESVKIGYPDKLDGGEYLETERNDGRNADP